VELRSRQVVARVVLVLTILATIGCDRVTKHVATQTLAGTAGRSYLADTVRFSYAQNTGGFLGLGSDLPPAARTAVFTGATGIALLGLIAFGARLNRGGWPAFGLTLFFAGSLSNWLDRLIRGSVVDFMIVGVGPLRTGIFNVADVAILLGVAIFVTAEYRRERLPGTVNTR